MGRGIPVDPAMRRPKEATTDEQISVAIVGTGLAGLTTAYILNSDTEQRYRISLFEQVRWVRHTSGYRAGG